MKLITKAQMVKLCKNGKSGQEDHKPVVKLFTPWTGCTWLLSEKVDEDRFFGLCDLGHGYPELGYVSLKELEGIRGPAGIKIERDMYFQPVKRLSEYAKEAKSEGRIDA